MDVNDLAGIKIREVSVIACPVCLPFQTRNMVHCERDVILAAVFRNDFVEATQFVCFLTPKDTSPRPPASKAGMTGEVEARENWTGRLSALPAADCPHWFTERTG